MSHVGQLAMTPSDTQLVFWLLWAGLGALSLSLVVLMWTRWGQTAPLAKCFALSLLAHLLMGLYATTLQLRFELPGANAPTIHVAILDNKAPDDSTVESGDRPWEELQGDAMTEPQVADAERVPLEPLPEPERQSAAPSNPLADRPALDHLAMTEIERPEPRLPEEATSVPTGQMKEAEAVDAPTATRRDAPTLPLPPAQELEARVTPDELAKVLERSANSGVSTSLLDQLNPLPRLQEPLTPITPGDSLPDNAYAMTPTSRGAPPAGAGGAGLAAAQGSNDRIANAPSPTQGLERMNAPSLAGIAAGPTANMALAGVPHESLPGAPQMPDVRRGEIGDAAERYRMRTAPNRAQLAEQRGATQASETAVRAALEWLAKNQAPDGHWDASDHGAGREDAVLGRNRQNAGTSADTGITGLAVLAFLASGHTHQSGDYQETVRRGLESLLRAQTADGNLGAQADNYARMYCHAMATLALSETLGMTDDPTLREPVRRAIGYTVAAQSPSTGGWRYVPADPGDTSLFGWQWMALVSGEAANVAIPERTQQGAVRFLRSVSSGKVGGLASYRPGEAPTRPMTAEALYCWELIGLPADHPAVVEASEAILGELPGTGRHNCYYTYYATLALYHLQNDAWRRWNDAMARVVVDRQAKSGPQAGSWDTDTVWGGYGGRVYTTAISTLTLEVYYRYLPLYNKSAIRLGHAPGDSTR